MIEVRITKSNGHEIAKIVVENMPPHDDDFGDYSVRIGIDNALGSVAAYQRFIENFPRTKYNVLALLLQALNTLSEEELRLDDAVDSSDLARRQRGTLPEI